MFNPGETISDGLRAVRVIGTGGLSEIWLAENGCESVAVKIFKIDPDWSESETAECRDYFLSESITLKSLNHPNIVSFKGDAEVNGIPVIKLEFIEGQNLRRWMDRERPPRRLEQFFKMAKGAASAVRHLHGSGLVHRDLAPRNIMVTEQGETIVLDFQFARSIPLAETPPAKLSHGIGDWAFSAPELIDMLDDPYDERVDIYSLGAVLIELLTGRPPRRLPPSLDHVPRKLLDTLWAMVSETPSDRPGWDEISEALRLP